MENEVSSTKKFTLFCAISPVDIPYFEIKDISQKSTTSMDMVSFIQNLHSVLPQHYQILLDNAPIHTSRETSSIIQSLDRNFLFIPPYHPELNPIEFVFSEWKRALYGTDIRNLPQNLTHLIRHYNENHYRKLSNYYYHSFIENTKSN